MGTIQYVEEAYQRGRGAIKEFNNLQGILSDLIRNVERLCNDPSAKVFSVRETDG